MNKDIPEAPAVGFFTYRRRDGFEVNITYRDTDDAMLDARLQAAIGTVIAAGGEPVSRNGNRDVRPASRPATPPRQTGYVGDGEEESRPCPIHPGMSLQMRHGKYGVFYSHKNHDGTWCTGKV